MLDFAPTCRLIYILYSVGVKGLRPAFLIRRAFCLHTICTDKVLAKEAIVDKRHRCIACYRRCFCCTDVFFDSFFEDIVAINAELTPAFFID